MENLKLGDGVLDDSLDESRAYRMVMDNRASV